MDIEILYKPSYSLGVLKLAGGEQVRVEGGAMVSMSAGITIETKAAGGILKSLARSMLGGESFFQNVYQAPSQGGEVSVAPALPGDLFSIKLQNESLMVQSGSYVASESGVELDTKWGGAKTFFASEGLIMLRSSGDGMLLLSSSQYGCSTTRPFLNSCITHGFVSKSPSARSIDSAHSTCGRSSPIFTLRLPQAISEKPLIFSTSSTS